MTYTNSNNHKLPIKQEHRDHSYWFPCNPNYNRTHQRRLNETLTCKLGQRGDLAGRFPGGFLTLSNKDLPTINHFVLIIALI